MAHQMGHVTDSFSCLMASMTNAREHRGHNNGKSNSLRTFFTVSWVLAYSLPHRFSPSNRHHHLR
jgi:hypothetical protein